MLTLKPFTVLVGDISNSSSSLLLAAQKDDSSKELLRPVVITPAGAHLLSLSRISPIKTA
jgi:hypothetical protein